MQQQIDTQQQSLEAIDSGWKSQLSGEFSQSYMLKLKDFIESEQKKSKTIYPSPQNYFNAFKMTPFDQVKVVILGQDPYHGPGQAHGLSFSVLPGVSHPPSLQNIFKELKQDLGDFEIPKEGDLSSWALQGVLLLNATLTVEKSRPGSHQGKGWEVFTDQVLRALNEDTRPKVFVLWGAYAQKKAHFLETQKHCVLRSAHPSPFSAHRGFFGSRPFSQANQFLKATGQSEIHWNLK